MIVVFFFALRKRDSVTMNWSALFLLVLFLPVTIQADQILDFAIDFTWVDNTGPIRVCNFVSCWGLENLSLMKKTSANFRCSIRVKSTVDSIFDWYIPGGLQLFVVDLCCPGINQFIKEAESIGLFNDQVKWLMITRGNSLITENCTTAAELLENVFATAISEVHVGNAVSGDRFEISSVYRRKKDSPLIWERFGYWTKAEGVVITGISLPTERRVNTNGILFRGVGVVVNDNALNHLYDLEETEMETPAKIHFTYWDHVVQAMNGSLKFLVARSWGENNNGSYDGMLGFIERNDADIAISPAFLTQDRLRFMRYLAIGYFIRIHLMFFSPPLSYNNNIYVLPFSTELWLSFFFMLGLSCVLLRIVSHYEVQDDPRNKGLIKSWRDIVTLHIGTICQQDTHSDPKGVCGRIIILHIKILVLFIYVFYSAVILVLLQTSDRSITTFKDLERSNFIIGGHDTPYNRFYMMRSPDPTVRSLVRRSPNSTRFLSAEEGIKRVQQGFYAFNIDTATGYLVVRELFSDGEGCRLQLLKDILVPRGDPLMGVRRDLPYREIMKILLQKISERGLMRRENRRRTAGKPPCESNRISYTHIGIVDSEGAFILLLYGYIASVAILFAELVWHRRTGRKTKPLPLYRKYGYYD